MKKGKLVALVVTVLVLVGALWGSILALGLEPQLGLDLQGGVSITLIPAPGQGEVDEAVLDQTVAIIRQRVDALGVAEPEIARQGDTVLVQLPGVADREQAEEVIGRTAQLQFRPVIAVIPPAGAEPLPSPAPGATASPGPAVGPTPAPTGTPGPTGTAAGTPAPAPTATEPESEAGAAPAETPTAAEPTAAPTTTDPAAPTSPTPGAPVDPGALEADDIDCGALQASIPPPEEEVVLCMRAFEERTPENPNPDELPTDQWAKLRLGAVALAGDDVSDARATVDQFGLNWSVDLELSDEGAEKFEQITGQLACNPENSPQRQLAIVLDGVVESAPTMAGTVVCNQGIGGGNATITTGGGEADAKQLAIILRTGALPIDLDFATSQSVSPTLGRSSLQAGLLAGLIGLILVAVYMVALYRGIGVATIAELAMFGLIVYGTIILLGNTVGFTLTLAGIAGVIVSIGIAADSSIIYRERYRDELRAGRTIRTAADKAFERAFRTNLTGNTVSFMAAVVLYLLAVGPVRGFAFTLGLATLVDTLLFATFTRGLFGMIARSPRLARSRWVGLRAGVVTEPSTAGVKR